MPLSNGILAFEFVLNSANDNHGVKLLFFLARKDNYRIWTELSGISTLSNEFTGNKMLLRRKKSDKTNTDKAKNLTKGEVTALSCFIPPNQI